MLAKIPTPQPYAEWMRISSAVWAALPMAEGCKILQEWAPEIRPGEYATKHKCRMTKVGIGTLVHLAQQNGWTPPASRGKHPGKVRVASAPVRTSRNTRPNWLYPTTDRLPEVRPPTPPSPPPAAISNRTHQTGTLATIIKPPPLHPPAEWCPVCWVHWARALRPGACICSGHVLLGNKS